MFQIDIILFNLLLARVKTPFLLNIAKRKIDLGKCAMETNQNILITKIIWQKANFKKNYLTAFKLLMIISFLYKNRKSNDLPADWLKGQK